MKTTSPQTLALIEETLEAARLYSPEDLSRQTRRLLGNLYNLANFAEAKNILLYLPYHGGFKYKTIIRNLFLLNKALHFIDTNDFSKLKTLGPNILKATPLKEPFNLPRPNPITCKQVRLSDIDIVIVNGIAFDEKGNRMGNGNEFYDKLSVRLAPTVRKIALAYETQLLPAIPADARNKPVDIIVTDKRTIYKI